MNIIDRLETKRKELIECVNNNDRTASDVIKKSEELDIIINNFYQYNYKKKEVKNID